MARTTKTENGVEFPAEAYAYVPDPENPSTWKLRLWEDPEKKETPRQVGMAIAALGPGGFRGNRAEIPAEDLAKVKARCRAAWKKVHPEADPDEMPAVIREEATGAEGRDAEQEGVQRLLEFTAAATRARVDRERSLIAGVKLLGVASLNGRTYSPQALADAAKLYEGKPVNVDHVDGSRRSYRDRIGRIAKVRLEADGLYGDLIVNPKHPLAEQLFWDAERCPENVGLSHDAQGRTRVENGRVVVESIEAVRSVDLVAEPATTRSLYEDQTPAAAVAEPSPAVAAQEPLDAKADELPDYDVDKLPDDAFALVLPGGIRIGPRTFPLHKRYFPLHAPDAVRRSLERIVTNRKLSAEHLKIARTKALEAARKFGIDITPHLASGLSKESMEMDIANLTLEQLKEARPDLIAQIQGASSVEAELVALKKERDHLAAELATLQKQQRLAGLMKEMGLREEQVPASLRDVLREADESKQKQILQDVKQMVQKAHPVRSSRPGDMLPENFEQRVNAWIH